MGGPRSLVPKSYIYAYIVFHVRYTLYWSFVLTVIELKHFMAVKTRYHWDILPITMREGFGGKESATAVLLVPSLYKPVLRLLLPRDIRGLAAKDPLLVQLISLPILLIWLVLLLRLLDCKVVLLLSVASSLCCSTVDMVAVESMRPVLPMFLLRFLVVLTWFLTWLLEESCCWEDELWRLGQLFLFLY